MKNALEVRESILTLHEDELDNALWINDLHIVPMTREAEPEIPHEVGAGQLEMFLISSSRRAGADLRLLQKAMDHASITVTAHTYADLFDDELDNIAAALDSLPDF
jgi:hypothetical protein